MSGGRGVKGLKTVRGGAASGRGPVGPAAGAAAAKETGFRPDQRRGGRTWGARGGVGGGWRIRCRSCKRRQGGGEQRGRVVEGQVWWLGMMAVPLLAAVAPRQSNPRCRGGGSWRRRRPEHQLPEQQLRAAPVVAGAAAGPSPVDVGWDRLPGAVVGALKGKTVGAAKGSYWCCLG